MSLCAVVRRVFGREVPARDDRPTETPAERDAALTALLAHPLRFLPEPDLLDRFLPDYWDGRETPAGECGVCHQPVESYSQLAEHVARQITRRPDRYIAPTRPLRAHPCGHDQPGPVIFNGVFSPTYAGPTLTERQHP